MIQCPVCGYNENVATMLHRNVMSTYVIDGTNAVDGTYNSDEKYLTVNGVKLRRIDVPKEVKSVTPAPVKVITPSK